MAAHGTESMQQRVALRRYTEPIAMRSRGYKILAAE
jgi:hypothetical protein